MITKILISIIVFVIVVIFYVRYLEKTTVFVPSKPIEQTPDAANLPFEDVYFKTEDGVTLNGWFIPFKAKSSTLIFFHGNAGNIGDRLGKLTDFHILGLNVFIIDYRGYGRSHSEPTEEGMYRDARAAYDYLLTRVDVDPKKIIVYGASLGGAAAVDLAANRSVAGVIIDSSFTNAIDMAKVIFPFLPSVLVNVLISTKLDSLAKIKNITAPKLFFHSPVDNTVPYEFGRKLYNAAPLPKRFVDTDGDHNDSHILERELFMQEVSLFVKKIEEENQ